MSRFYAAPSNRLLRHDVVLRAWRPRAYPPLVKYYIYIYIQILASGKTLCGKNGRGYGKKTHVRDRRRWIIFRSVDTRWRTISRPPPFINESYRFVPDLNASEFRLNRTCHWARDIVGALPGEGEPLLGAIYVTTWLSNVTFVQREKSNNDCCVLTRRGGPTRLLKFYPRFFPSEFVFVVYYRRKNERTTTCRCSWKTAFNYKRAGY